MEDTERLAVLKAKRDLLAMLIDRECKCDRRMCDEHFRYMEVLKFDYECKIEDYEKNYQDRD